MCSRKKYNLLLKKIVILENEWYNLTSGRYLPLEKRLIAKSYQMEHKKIMLELDRLKIIIEREQEIWTKK